MQPSTEQVSDVKVSTIQPDSRMNFFRVHIVRICIVLVLCILIIVGYIFRNNIPYLHSNDITLSDAKKLTDKVGKLVFLPTDEVPTIAKISNKELLKNQPFFVDAKTGDIVLIFTNAKKAILYDPVANKIVNMTTVNVGGDKAVTPSSEKSSPDMHQNTSKIIPGEF